MSHALTDCRAIEPGPAIVPPAIAARWSEFRAHLARWSARWRLARSIAHLDDRLLADIGLGPDDLGLAEQLIRRRLVGGVWTKGGLF